MCVFGLCLCLCLSCVSVHEILHQEAHSLNPPAHPPTHPTPPTHICRRCQVVESCKILGVDLAALRCVHIAGTKGKGSTSSFTERILRQAGYKTGLYTSPHLVDVRERFRINGKVLQEDRFTLHFWHVHDTLTSAGEDLHFFHFLTVLGFYIFQVNRTAPS